MAGRKQARTAAMRKDVRARWVKVAVVCALAALLVLLALTVGDAEYHATATGWMPLACLVFVLLMDAGYVHLCRAQVRLRPLPAPAECSRGEEVVFGAAVRNRLPFPLFGLEARFSISDAQGLAASEARSTLTLGSRAEGRLAFAAALEHVGRFRLGVHQARINDFLGLASLSVPSPASVEVCVTPSLVTLPRVRFDNRAMEDLPRPQKAVLADSMDYAYVRPYAPGDPLKTVHWKLSARSEGLQTRLFEQPVNPGVAVVLDYYVPDELAESRFSLVDCVVEAGLSLARAAQRQGVDVEIRYWDAEGHLACLPRWDEGLASAFVESMPLEFCGAAARACSEALLDAACGHACRQPNLVVCSANLEQHVLSRIVDAKLARRSPMLVAAVPPLLVDRERERYMAPLGQLESMGIPTHAVSHANELAGVAL